MYILCTILYTKVPVFTREMFLHIQNVQNLYIDIKMYLVSAEAMLKFYSRETKFKEILYAAIISHIFNFNVGKH